MLQPILKAHVDGLAFLSQGTEGPIIQPDGLTGWWGRPASSGSQSARPGAHGEFDLPAFVGGRIVTIQGWVEGNPLEWDAWCDRLSGLGASGDRVRVVVEENGDSTWAWCRVMAVQVTRSTAKHPPAFMVTLRAANPRRYGAVRGSAPTSTTRHTMLNRGNFPAAPRFFVTGPQPGGYSIIADGKPNYQVNTVTPAGKTDVIDFSTGRVTRDGVSLLGAVLAPRPWTVPGGGEQKWYAAPTGAAGSVYGELTDTYV